MDNHSSFPKMFELRQNYPASPRLDFPEVVGTSFRESGVLSKITPGMRVAVGVGSRGIGNLKEIVQAVLGVLNGAGAKPFIVPAMGSHGGATPGGQEKVLAEYGVTKETMRVPFETSMETRKIGTTPEGLDVVFSQPALAADGIVVINRIKPHTNFRSTFGSGIQKMLVIGFGKQLGAANAHRAAAHLGYATVLGSSAKLILSAAPVLGGVAIIEDQNHQTASIDVVAADVLIQQEERLFQRAKSLMPGLPFDQIDLLIVDQIGKEISGAGMDPNVTGRDVLGYVDSLHPNGPHKPHVTRIFVRDLTDATNGNGIGIGIADFTTSRAVKALNLPYLYVNGLTSLSMTSVKIPMHFDTDREVLQHAIASLGAASSTPSRIVRIKNTLELGKMLVSEACAPEAAGRQNLTIAQSAKEMEFTSDGNLTPL